MPLAAFELRLDEDIAASLGRAAATSTATLTAGELRARVFKARDRAAALAREAAERGKRLAATERRVDELRRLSLTQDHAIEALRIAVRAAAPREPASPSAPAARAPGAASPATAVPRSATGSALADERTWLEGALVVAIVLLLGWALHLRARALAGDRAVEEEEQRRLAVARKAAEGLGDGRAESGRPRRRGHERTAAPPGGTGRRAEPAASGAPAGRAGADQDALREVDTLIAYADYARAEQRLDELMSANPGNPEYHLRLLHIQAAAGDERKSAEEERILAAMMDGPLSETINRVREIGRGLMPGHPLFDDEAQAEVARRLIGEQTSATPFRSLDTIATRPRDGHT